MKGVPGMEAMSLLTPYQQTQFSIGCGAEPASTISPDAALLLLV
jgi:hypothetical protein